jgi:hypothetical protein
LITNRSANVPFTAKLLEDVWRIVEKTITEVCLPDEAEKAPPLTRPGIEAALAAGQGIGVHYYYQRAVLAPS